MFGPLNSKAEWEQAHKNIDKAKKAIEAREATIRKKQAELDALKQEVIKIKRDILEYEYKGRIRDYFPALTVPEIYDRLVSLYRARSYDGTEATWSIWYELDRLILTVMKRNLLSAQKQEEIITGLVNYSIESTQYHRVWYAYDAVKATVNNLRLFITPIPDMLY